MESKKQPTIAFSSTEVEYRALRKVVAEVIWFTHLFADTSLIIHAIVPIVYDSRAATHIAKNPFIHERTKPIEIDCHYDRDYLFAHLISLHHISSAA